MITISALPVLITLKLKIYWEVKTYESPTPVAPGDDDYNNDVDYYNDDYNDIEMNGKGCQSLSKKTREDIE